MKTQTAAFQTIDHRPAIVLREIRRDARGLTHRLLRWGFAGFAATATLVISIWAALNPAMTTYLGVSLWGLGFVFFALAVEAGQRRAVPLVLTGMALPVLALVGDRLAGEFSILAGAIVAGWLAHWIAGRD